MENMEKKNSVESKNQVSRNVFFEGSENGRPRVMFVGNSITRHSPAPHIGWNGDWGMAASAKEKDYVHLCIKYIKEKYPEATFCIIQASVWEREYKNNEVLENFSDAQGFNPDLIITRLSENIPMDYIERDSLVVSMHELHKYLSGDNERVKLIVTSNVFGNDIKDEALIAYSKEHNAEYVFIDDYKKDESNFANEFEHEGVRIHPGDKGMRFIADRIISAIDKVM